MLRNNFFSLLLYIGVGIYTFVTYVFIGLSSLMIKTPLTSILKWGHGNLIMPAICIVGLILYFIFGFFVMIDKGSKIKNLFSVSLIFFINVLSWLYYYITEADKYQYYIYNYFNSYMMPIFDPKGNLVPIWLSPIPTILFWLGLECKIYIRKIKMRK